LPQVAARDPVSSPSGAERAAAGWGGHSLRRLVLLRLLLEWLESERKASPISRSRAEAGLGWAGGWNSKKREPLAVYPVWPSDEQF